MRYNRIFPSAGARSAVSGFISNGSTWYEDIEIIDDGTFVADAEDWEWQFRFRTTYDDAPTLTLSTTDGTLTIVQGSTSTILQIRVAYTALSAIEGDYIADLASKDSDDRVIHWAHGTVTFRYEPVWS